MIKEGYRNTSREADAVKKLINHMMMNLKRL